MVTESSGSSLLEMRLLGACEVWVQGKPLPALRYRKDLWLLAHLTLHHERSVDREELAGLLWPDAEPSQARYYLRRALSNLRRALGSEARRLLTPSPHSVRLDLSDADCDLLAFDAALARAGVSLTPEEPLQQAILLYRGPLLPGCLEEWVLPERNARELAYLAALERLARIAQEKGDSSAAVRWLRLLLAADPYRESAYNTLMQALADCGDMAAVTQVYRDLRLLLRRDINAEPAAETDALYRSLLAREARPAVLPPAAPPSTGPPRRLPVPLSHLIGREQGIEEVGGWLSKCRLVTLVGTGGVGKTRLSIAAAERIIGQFPDGVWFADLAPLRDPALLAQTVQRLFGIQEEPFCTPEETLEQALSSRTLLLVMDNCEHLLESCASLTHRLLSACPGLRILATSREAMGLPGEHLYPVPSLSLPLAGQANVEKAASSLLEYEAVRLFVERARQSSPSFQLTRNNAGLVTQICGRLDGNALAIEMAAARLKALTLTQIAERLEDRFQLLTRGRGAALPRQRTLQATIDWSYDLLAEEERILFRRLSVFAGSWNLEASEAVCSNFQFSISDFQLRPTSSQIENGKLRIENLEVLDALTHLVEKSLVVFEEPLEGMARYRFLESLREYAWNRLMEAGEVEDMRDRHRNYFLALAEAATSKLRGAEQAEWLQRLEEEHENLRAGLDWTLLEPGSAERGLRYCGALQRFWGTRGYLSEGREWSARALGKAGAQAQTSERANVLNGAGSLAYFQGDYASASAYYEESLLINREIGDPRPVAISLNNLGNVAYHLGHYATASAYFEESLSIRREMGDRSDMDAALNNLGNVAFSRGDYASAHAFYEESLTIVREIGDQWGMAQSLCNLGGVALLQGDPALARAYFDESLTIRREIGDRRGIADSLGGLGNVACSQNDFASAQTYHEESLTLRREIGDRPGMAASLTSFAGLAIKMSRLDQAATLWGASERLREQIGSPLSPNERDPYDRDMASVRQSLGEEAFSAAWLRGRGVTLEQAIASALRETEP